MSATPPLRLAIAGAGGRMGRMLLDAAAVDADVIVSAALEHTQSPLVGQRVGNHVIVDDVEAAVAASDALIDFTRPEGTLAHLAACVRHGTAAVIGTTGFTPEQIAQLTLYSQRIGIVFAPNMSLGVNVTAKLVALAAKSLGMGTDIEVFEAHHKLKVDAPSGTALMLGRVAAEARGQQFDEVAVYNRHAVSGERRAGSIGFSAMRAGDIVGDHTVFLVLDGERIEISHKATSRVTYAQGAIRAAKFLAMPQLSPRTGLFDMNDVLGLT